jgi:hypothetical protein
MPATSGIFFKKDSRQAGMTAKEQIVMTAAIGIFSSLSSCWPVQHHSSGSIPVKPE